LCCSFSKEEQEKKALRQLQLPLSAQSAATDLHIGSGHKLDLLKSCSNTIKGEKNSMSGVLPAHICNFWLTFQWFSKARLWAVGDAFVGIKLDHVTGCWAEHPFILVCVLQHDVRCQLCLQQVNCTLSCCACCCHWLRQLLPLAATATTASSVADNISFQHHKQFTSLPLQPTKKEKKLVPDGQNTQTTARQPPN
jgi:hypothetical protein